MPSLGRFCGLMQWADAAHAASNPQQGAEPGWAEGKSTPGVGAAPHQHADVEQLPHERALGPQHSHGGPVRLDGLEAVRGLNLTVQHVGPHLQAGEGVASR
jgi:hypothetical protein